MKKALFDNNIINNTALIPNGVELFNQYNELDHNILSKKLIIKKLNVIFCFLAE